MRRCFIHYLKAVPVLDWFECNYPFIRGVTHSSVYWLMINSSKIKPTLTRCWFYNFVTLSILATVNNRQQWDVMLFVASFQFPVSSFQFPGSSLPVFSSVWWRIRGKPLRCALILLFVVDIRVILKILTRWLWMNDYLSCFSFELIYYFKLSISHMS